MQEHLDHLIGIDFHHVPELTDDLCINHKISSLLRGAFVTQLGSG